MAPELGQDLNAYNLDAEVELTSILSGKLLWKSIPKADSQMLQQPLTIGLVLPVSLNRETGAELGATSAAPASGT